MQKKNQKKKFTISNELSDKVMKFKEHKIKNGTYEEKTFITPTGKSTNDHLELDLTRSMMQKGFKKSCKNNSNSKSKIKIKTY